MTRVSVVCCARRGEWLQIRLIHHKKACTGVSVVGNIVQVDVGEVLHPGEALYHVDLSSY